MTLLDVVFKYGTPPGEREMMALNNAWEVYGVRKIKFDEKERTIRVEYDATRPSEIKGAGPFLLTRGQQRGRSLTRFFASSGRGFRMWSRGARYA